MQDNPDDIVYPADDGQVAPADDQAPLADAQQAAPAPTSDIVYSQPLGTGEMLWNAAERGARALYRDWQGLDNQMAGLSMAEDIQQRIAAGEDSVWTRRFRDNPELLETMRGQMAENAAVAAPVVAEQNQAINALRRNPSSEAMTRAKTWGEAWDHFTSAPLSIIAEIGLESFVRQAPSFAAAGVSGAVGGLPAFMTAMGLGSAHTEYVGGIFNALSEAGVDITNADALRQAFSDRDLMARIRHQSAVKAGVVGTFDALSGSLAGRSLLPARVLAERPVVRGVAEVGAQLPVQGAMGGAGEALGSLASGQDVEPGAVLGEIVGEAFTAPAEVLGARRLARRPEPVPPAPPPAAGPPASDAAPVAPPGPQAAISGFYAPAERAIETSRRVQGPAQAWLNDLKKAGVSNDELDWMGFPQWMEENRGRPVSREEMAEFIRENGANLVEVRQETDAVSPLTNDERIALGLPGETQFANNFPSGVTNPRNFLVQAPGLNYQSPHFGGPTISFIRVGDVTGPNGERTLLVHGNQSELHQEAERGGGYGKRERTPEQEKRFQELSKLFDRVWNREFSRKDIERGIDTDRLTDLLTGRIDSTHPSIVAMARIEPRLVRDALDIRRFTPEFDSLRDVGDDVVPNAPLKGDRWWQLGLKLALRQAVAEGYDAVAISTADQVKATDGNAPKSLYDSKMPSWLGKYVKPMGGVVERPGTDREILKSRLFNTKENALAVFPRGSVLGDSPAPGQWTVHAPGRRAIFGRVPGAMIGFIGTTEGGFYVQSNDPDVMEKATYKARVTQHGSPLVRITPQMRESISKGQPLFAGGSEQRQKNIRTILKMGRNYNLLAATPAAVLRNIETSRYSQMLPQEVDVGALARIEPIAGTDPDVAIRVVFRLSSGEEAAILLPLARALRYRAIAIPGNYISSGTDTVAFLRLDPPSSLDERLIGEYRHEVTHVLRNNGYLRGPTWVRLLAHARALKVGEMDLGEALFHFGNDNFKNAVGVSIEETYRDDIYAGRPDIEEAVDQELVTHMLELHHHGYFSDEQMSPIMDILRDLESGVYSGGGERVAGTAPAMAIAGPRAKTASKGNLAQAQKMAQRGRNPNTIWEATGWGLDPADSKWKWEIDDSPAKLINLNAHLKPMSPTLWQRLTIGKARKPPKWATAKTRLGTNIKLPQILQHPELYKAYPFLQRMNVNMAIGQDIDRTRLGGLLAVSEGEGKRTYRPIRVIAASENEAIDTLLHEIQHYIQNVEGFSPGASAARSDIPLVEGGRSKATFSPDTGLARVGGERGILATTQAEDLARLIRKTESEPQSSERDADLKKLTDLLAENLRLRSTDYVSAAGEIEADVVASRRNLDRLERRENMPFGSKRIPIRQTGSFPTAANETDRRAQLMVRLAEARAAPVVVGDQLTAVRLDDNTVVYMDPDGVVASARLYEDNAIAGPHPVFDQVPYNQTVPNPSEHWARLSPDRQAYIRRQVERDLRSRNYFPSWHAEWQDYQAAKYGMPEDLRKANLDPPLWMSSSSGPMFAIGGGGPVSLVSFIRAQGGIRDERGELAAILDRPGSKGYIPGIINNKTGIHPDRMRERLVQAGYLRESGQDQPAITSVNDVYDLVRRAYGGERVLPIGEYAEPVETRPDAAEIINQAVNVLNEAGMDYYLTEAEEARVVELVSSGVSVDDAIERATMESVDGYESGGREEAGAIGRRDQTESAGRAEGEYRAELPGDESTWNAGAGEVRPTEGAETGALVPVASPPAVGGSGGFSAPPGGGGRGGRGGPGDIIPPDRGGEGPRSVGSAPVVDASRNWGPRDWLNAVREKWYSLGRTAETWWNPINGLPDLEQYRIGRYRMLGRIDHGEEMSKLLWRDFKDASKADKKAAYTYLTTRGVSANAISDPKVRQAAVASKQLFNALGIAAVERGLIPQAALDKYRDQYLPRIYLAHILKKGSILGFSGNARPSDLGWTKHRKDIDKETRILLGEVMDPGYLAARGIFRMHRDMSIIDFLSQISNNDDWVFNRGLAEYGGKKVSPYYLRAEAQALRERAGHEPDAEYRGAMITAARDMEEAAAPFIRENENVPDGFAQIPDSKRYGMLRGMYVRKEIKNDLLPNMTMIPEDASWWEKFLSPMGAGGKFQALWKAYHVPMNPSTQLRNIMSNTIMMNLSGMPWRRIGSALGRSVREWSSNGPTYRAALKLGLKASGFSEQELRNVTRAYMEAERALLREKAYGTMMYPLQIMKHIHDTVLTKAGDLYQFSETVFKLAMMMDAIKHEGMSPEEAFLKSQKWLFDYSDVPQSVRYMRSAPVGIPFATYYYKVMPRLIEVAATKPWRLAPYIALPYIMGQAFMWGWDAYDDDEEKRRNPNRPNPADRLAQALPEYLRNKSNAFIMPWKDANGRWQFFDFGYLLPWSMFQETAQSLYNLDISGAMRQSGFLGGPMLDLITFIKSKGQDPFTGRKVVDPRDPMSTQVWSTMGWLWDQTAPPLLTSKGAIAKMHDTYNGVPDRYGNPGLTMAQSVARLFGINVYPVDPDTMISQNVRRMQFEIREATNRLRSIQRNQSLSDARRQSDVATQQAHISRLRQAMQDYQTNSEVHPRLRTVQPLPAPPPSQSGDIVYPPAPQNDIVYPQ